MTGSDAGHSIVVVSWAAVGLFAVTAVPAAAGVSALDSAALATDVALFLVGIGVWVWAFGAALVRSANGDDIVVGTLFLVEGSAPGRIRVQLFVALAASVAIAAGTATSNTFGILVPMLPLGLVGLWGARHGEFPRRRGR